MENNIINEINSGYIPLKEENIYNSLFDEYERIIVQSLITSFGLELFIKIDQYGGDVDTVHNVRKIGLDEQMNYKNKQHEKSFNNRGDYNYSDYHSGQSNFSTKKSNARHEYNENGTLIEDAYTGKNLRYTKASAVPKDKRVELDHVVECKGIHEDRGRLLSGLSGIELADSDENFAWTNKPLNASMGTWAKNKNEKWKKEHGCDAPLSEVDMVAYIQEGGFDKFLENHPEIDINPDTTKKRMLEQYRKSRKAYEAKINRAYYTSSSFFRDTTKAAIKVGLTMGLRQALGLVFSEIWFAVKEKIKERKDLNKNLFISISDGVKIGFENAKFKYKEIWDKFIEGSIAGILSSLTTTICNIFFTTAKNTVKIFRQSWASLVEATKILLFNPDCLPFGERFRASAKIIATGASVVVGSLVGDMIAKTGVSAIPVVGEIVQTFCSTLVTGIMTCSLLTLLDRYSAINELVKVLNTIPTIDDFVAYYNRQALLLEEYCAKLMNIDLECLKKETIMYSEAVELLEHAHDQESINNTLKKIYIKMNLSSPYGENIDSFMNNKSRKLSFC